MSNVNQFKQDINITYYSVLFIKNKFIRGMLFWELEILLYLWCDFVKFPNFSKQLF